MHNINQIKKILNAKTSNTNKPHNRSPKLTVEQIVTKFVTPSSHRKVIQLSEPARKTNKK